MLFCHLLIIIYITFSEKAKQKSQDHSQKPITCQVIGGTKRNPPPGITTEDFDAKHGSAVIDPGILFPGESFRMISRIEITS